MSGLDYERLVLSAGPLGIMQVMTKPEGRRAGGAGAPCRQRKGEMGAGWQASGWAGRRGHRRTHSPPARGNCAGLSRHLRAVCTRAGAVWLQDWRIPGGGSRAAAAADGATGAEALPLLPLLPLLHTLPAPSWLLQLIQAKLADMYTATAATRAFVYATAQQAGCHWPPMAAHEHDFAD